jgi:ATP-dependent DNA helicase RecG
VKAAERVSKRSKRSQHAQLGERAAGEEARTFRRLALEARAWLKAKPGGDCEALVAHAREATQHVPDDRRNDWEGLLAGFASDAPKESLKRRVEGLARATALFERQARDRIRLAVPLAWQDTVDRTVGLGPNARTALADRGVVSAADLVWTLPVGWDDLRAPITIAEALDRFARRDPTRPPERVCIKATVRTASFVGLRGRRSVRVIGIDGPGGATIDAWWFYAAHGVLEVARPGATCLLVGRITQREGKRPVMAHPDVLRDHVSARGVRPRYPALGVAGATLRRAIGDAVARALPLPDPVPAAVVAREGMPPAEPLLQLVHGTQPEDHPAEARRKLAERLAWVEGFTRVWQRLMADGEPGVIKAPSLSEKGGGAQARAKLEAALPFALTAPQRRAMDAIGADLAREVPMRRLLLGDVGTGKTVVALAAAAQCIVAGYQCALLGPTGVLADQYVDAAAPLVTALGIRRVSLTAGMRAAERRAALDAIASGEAGLVVGTHALLGEGVAFRRLGLVIVDEQQRLGVAQRLRLVRKGDGSRPHLLSLSATPIPRTLALALRGELATSVLDQRPHGRLPVATEVRPRGDFATILADVRAACADGGRAFVVCPRIDDDEDSGDSGVVARAEALRHALAPVKVVTAHGAMPPAERARSMRAFRAGEAQVLVGTTVIEVGLDVPEATLMVIDGSEGFGLAQLHQLRGRVGRGARPGRCILLHDEPLTELARQRLETLVTTDDGTQIARADLALRGAGDLGGTRQSGLAEDFAWLDPAAPPVWVERLEHDARDIVARDPRLEGPEHRALALAVRRFLVEIAVREEAG